VVCEGASEIKRGRKKVTAQIIVYYVRHKKKHNLDQNPTFGYWAKQ